MCIPSSFGSCEWMDDIVKEKRQQQLHMQRGRLRILSFSLHLLNRFYSLSFPFNTQNLLHINLLADIWFFIAFGSLFLMFLMAWPLALHQGRAYCGSPFVCILMMRYTILRPRNNVIVKFWRCHRTKEEQGHVVKWRWRRRRNGPHRQREWEKM